MEKSSFKSFTLVEMLIVIVIIGILTAALVPRLRGVIERAREKERQFNCRNACLEVNLDDPAICSSCFEVPCDHWDLKIENYQIMACNLGTTKAGTGEESYGAYFQRGNNYPFPMKGNIKTSTTKVDVSAYGPENYYESNIFITSNPASDWALSDTPNLWGESTNTNEARQGPCPNGYHIPSDEERVGLKNTLVNRKYIPNTSNGTAFVDVLLLPRNRYRSYASDYRGGLATEGIYWTSTPAPNEKAKSSFFTENMSIGNSLLGRNYGLGIRCFKNG